MTVLRERSRSLCRYALRGLRACVWFWLAAHQAHAWDDVDGPAPGDPESVGRYAAGCVIGAAKLPADGPGYQAIMLGRNRHYGHPALVRFVETLGGRAEELGLGLLPVGDLSQPRGRSSRK